MFGFFSVAFISRPKSRLTETNMLASCDSIVRTSEVENICQQINASLNIYKFHVKTHQDTSKTHKYLEFNTSDTNTHACILLFYNKLKTLSIFTSQTNCTSSPQKTTIVLLLSHFGTLGCGACTVTVRIMTYLMSHKTHATYSTPNTCMYCQMARCFFFKLHQTV